MFPALNWPDFQPMLSDGQCEQILSDLEESGLFTCDGFFDHKYIVELQNYCESLQKDNAFRQSAIGKKSIESKNIAIRSDSIFWIENFSGPMESIGKWLGSLADVLKLHFRQPISQIESHFSNYPPGSHYDKHKDNTSGEHQRLFTFIIYLNLNWKTGDGGELVIYQPDNPDRILKTVAPKAGTFVLFRSDLFAHEVRTANAHRSTFTGWLRRGPR